MIEIVAGGALLLLVLSRKNSQAPISAGGPAISPRPALPLSFPAPLDFPAGEVGTFSPPVTGGSFVPSVIASAPAPVQAPAPAPVPSSPPPVTGPSTGAKSTLNVILPPVQTTTYNAFKL